jgi:trehalose 6-phosphate synthase/phosphatase
MSQRLFIISNRLPIQAETKDNKIKLSLSSGGLVSAISSYIEFAEKEGEDNYEKYWVGVPGCSAGEWSTAAEQLNNSGYHYLPVFTNKKSYNGYYNGFSNSVLWPLFHYFPSYVEYNENNYEHYKKVNQDFADVIVKHVRETDILWVHDYQLLPLAGMIRDKIPNLTIGFFLHIPFPSYELFRMLPAQWQQELLKGMLGADLIGFHTIDYASHFLKCLQMVLGLENERFILKHNNRLIKADVFPISIDYNKWNAAYNIREIADMRTMYKSQIGERKMIFSVDRLDYTKGVLCRLKAYEKFLSLFPHYKGQVVFIMVIVPSRDTISRYNERKREIDEFIGNINSRIGTIAWKPIIYQYNKLSFEELVAFYTACDVALITPLRDGMNLVAKEFVASRKDKRGVLILSEMAGAAKELADAVSINPNDINGIAVKIKEALEMSEAEQEKRISLMQKRIAHYDVVSWAEDFLHQLKMLKSKQKEFEYHALDSSAKRDILGSYRTARKRLILLDYDGTLVPFSAFPDQSHPGKSLINILQLLASDARNAVYLISGRDSETLDKWLGAIPINLISEHGAKIKTSKGVWKQDLLIEIEDNWKDIINDVMDKYVKRCAKTFVEEKEYSLVWHYRNADPDQGKIRAAELASELSAYTNNLNIQVCSGNKIMEVRIKGVDKGSIVKKLLRENAYDFILACGDDKTDEDMFQALVNNKNAFTIKIGDEASYAKYNLFNPEMTVSFLEYLAGDSVLMPV